MINVLGYIALAACVPLFLAVAWLCCADDPDTQQPCQLQLPPKRQPAQPPADADWLADQPTEVLAQSELDRREFAGILRASNLTDSVD